MRPVLRPGAALLRRDASHLQIGATPGSASIVRERPGMLALLRMLDGVRDEQDLCDLVASDVPEYAGDPRDLIDRLRAAQVIVDADAWGGEPNPARRQEARHHTARGADQQTVSTRLHRRAQAHIEVTHDEHTRAGAVQVRSVLSDAGVAASLSPVEDPALVVVFSTGPCPREVFAVLANAHIPHLPVSWEEDRTRVGPLVRPGRTPCVDCDDHQRATWDPAWPALLSQLGLPLARPSVVSPHALSAVVAHVGAALVADDVLAFCDGRVARSEAAVLCIGPDARDLSRQPVAFSPACGCEILHDAPGHPQQTLVTTGTMEP